MIYKRNGVLIYEWKRVIMVKISVEIPDELDKRFRHAIIERLGSRKGALATAVREAMELWIAREEAKPKPK